MRVLIFHGYLLRGTGSNVYNASLARALAAAGHEVHLLCQDRQAERFDWVHAVGDWEEGSLRVRTTGAAAAGGSVTVYRPEIGGLLPVFVRDRYEGFEVKLFRELSEAELERYVEANARAAADVVARAGGVDAVLANHLVLGPAALARAGLRYALKVHGSDLEYTVLPDHERFGPWAKVACAHANGILVGSGHIAARLREAVPQAVLADKVRLGPPGVDTELFAPLPAPQARRRLRERARRIADAPARGSSWDRAAGEAREALEWFATGDGPRAIYVGKLIAAKGVDLLLAAWPLARAAAPDARLLIAGFGAFRGALEQLAAALAAGDLERARAVAAAGREPEGGPPGPLEMLARFLARPPAGYAEACRAAAGSVRFAGRLEHEEVAVALPAADALVFPSTAPEAFGMVAAEAAAAGALPVAAAHSGALEVSQALAAELPPEAAELLSFELGPDAVVELASRLGRWLSLPTARRLPISAALAAAARRRWSWERVCADVLAAARGRLDRLAVPA